MISKKKLKQIKLTSVVVEVLKEQTKPNVRMNNNEMFHSWWFEDAPETWHESETQWWDIAHEVERKLIDKITNILIKQSCNFYVINHF